MGEELITYQLMWYVALLERECRSCNGTGLHNWEDEPDGGLADPLPCDLCQSTGRVPLLDGVRKPCSYEDVSYPDYKLHGNNCRCYGLGWTPTFFYELLDKSQRPLAINATEAEQFVKENVK